MGRPTVGRGSRVRENKGLAGGIKEIFRIGLAAICRDKARSKTSAGFLHYGARVSNLLFTSDLVHVS
jgi:hypothetical protein